MHHHIGICGLGTVGSLASQFMVRRGGGQSEQRTQDQESCEVGECHDESGAHENSNGHRRVGPSGTQIPTAKRHA
jgi:hypothetical protein